MSDTRVPQPLRPFLVALALSCSAFVAQYISAAEPDKPKVLPPQEITLVTNDGVTLVATFYPSTAGKDAVPVILLHALKSGRGDFKELALLLQREGHAVIAPDLRLHGDSNAGRGVDRAIEPRPDDLVAMVQADVEAVKRFLLARNNAGEVNIDKLCLVGVEMGAAVAINWAALDWSWPVLNTGKQGQDVKALVLISPEWTFKGLRINDAVADPYVRADLSMLIVTGRGRGNSRLLQEANRLYAALERYHPVPPPELAAQQQTLWLQTPVTPLQGTRLLNEKSLQVHQMIVNFIEMRLVKQPLPWRDRTGPLQ